MHFHACSGSLFFALHLADPIRQIHGSFWSLSAISSCFSRNSLASCEVARAWGHQNLQPQFLGGAPGFSGEHHFWRGTPFFIKPPKVIIPPTKTRYNPICHINKQDLFIWGQHCRAHSERPPWISALPLTARTSQVAYNARHGRNPCRPRCERLRTATLIQTWQPKGDVCLALPFTHLPKGPRNKRFTLCRHPKWTKKEEPKGHKVDSLWASELLEALGVDSPFFSTIVLSKNRPISLVLRRLPRQEGSLETIEVENTLKHSVVYFIYYHVFCFKKKRTIAPRWGT